MARDEFAPVTPGEMLKEEFLTEYGLSQNRLAKAIGISPNRITGIVITGGASRPTRPCVWACTSAIARSSG